MWSSVQLTTSTPHWRLSRLNHAACTLSVYASQPGSPPDHATLDSGWWPSLTGQDSHLLGRVEGFRHVYPSTWLRWVEHWRAHPLAEGFQPRPFGCEVGSQFRHRPRFQPPPLKFRTSGFPTVRLQASGTHQFGQEPSACLHEVIKADPAMPPRRPTFTPAFGCVGHRTGYPPQRAVPGFNAATCAQRSSLRVGCVVPPLIAWRPHPPVWTAPPHFPASPVIDAVFGIQGPSCLPPRPSGLSPLYFPGLPPSAFAGSPGTCTPVLPYRHWPSDKGEKSLGDSKYPLESASCGACFRRLVRSLSLRPSCLLASLG